MGGMKAYVDDVTEAAKFTMTKRKIPTDRDADVQCNQWAGLHINMTAIKSFFYNRESSGISLDSPSSKRPGPIFCCTSLSAVTKPLDTGTPPTTTTFNSSPLWP